MVDGRTSAAIRARLAVPVCCAWVMPWSRCRASTGRGHRDPDGRWPGAGGAPADRAGRGAAPDREIDVSRGGTWGFASVDSTARVSAGIASRIFEVPVVPGGPAAPWPFFLVLLAAAPAVCRSRCRSSSASGSRDYTTGVPMPPPSEQAECGGPEQEQRGWFGDSGGAKLYVVQNEHVETTTSHDPKTTDVVPPVFCKRQHTVETWAQLDGAWPSQEPDGGSINGRKVEPQVQLYQQSWEKNVNGWQEESVEPKVWLVLNTKRSGYVLVADEVGRPPWRAVLDSCTVLGVSVARIQGLVQNHSAAKD